jgi:hypothetical protein
VKYAVVKILERADDLEVAGRRRRVKIVRREGGSYGLMEEYWARSEWEGKLIEERWVALGKPSSFYATLEIAEREALAEVPWLNAARDSVDDSGSV